MKTFKVTVEWVRDPNGWIVRTVDNIVFVKQGTYEEFQILQPADGDKPWTSQETDARAGVSVKELEKLEVSGEEFNTPVLAITITACYSGVYIVGIVSVEKSATFTLEYPN
jgi:hypothetical protein